MARVVGVVDTSHVWVESPPRSAWDSIRESRSFIAGVPIDTPDEQVRKEARIQSAVAVLRDKLAAMRPDLLLVFGDDQSENFSPEFTLMPAVTIFAGEEFSGRRYNAGPDSPHQKVPGHPELAYAILTGLLTSGFDPAFCLGLPNPDRGIGHAIMNPLGYYTDYRIPVVPILINALFAPQVSASRARQLGNAIRTIIDGYPEDLRVVAIGSGGLWHTGNSAPETYLNEEFDEISLHHLRSGDMQGWVDHFDNYKVPEGDLSQSVAGRGRVKTGLATISGPQYGTRETLNWIAASSVVEGNRFTVVDRIPLYCSPIDVTFAYCDEVSST